MRFFHLLFLLSLLVLISGASAGGVEEGEIMAEQKTEFPEMVGMSGEEAKAQLESQFPSFQIDIVPWDAMLTMDYREDRIRVKVDDNGKVKKAPRVG
mmetsp:Transcript_38087/g.92183  ORF Transcript_38087/g.92183 Transcript_38087/m.92183 type:complete len:97 (+) Transcript_38087:38-328(+)